MQNHYPWNTKALIDWLRQELDHRDKQTLASKLKVPRYVLQAWLYDPAPTITLAYIRAIAQYRGWNLNQIIDWLKIQPAHVQELINQDSPAAN